MANSDFAGAPGSETGPIPWKPWPDEVSSDVADNGAVIDEGSQPEENTAVYGPGEGATNDDDVIEVDEKLLNGGNEEVGREKSPEASSGLSQRQEGLGTEPAKGAQRSGDQPETGSHERLIPLQPRDYKDDLGDTDRRTDTYIRATTVRLDPPAAEYRVPADVAQEPRPGSHIELWRHPSRPDSEFEKALQDLSKSPYVNLENTHADGASLLLGAIRTEQLALPEDQQTDAAREAAMKAAEYASVEESRVARVRLDPESFSDVVAEESQKPGGAWGELIAARGDVDEIIKEFYQRQKAGPAAALQAALTWTKDEAERMGMGPRERALRKRVVSDLQAKLFTAIGKRSGPALEEAFGMLDKYVDGMVDEYAHRCTAPNTAASVQGWQPPIRSVDNDLRRLHLAAIKYCFMANPRYNLGGQEAADMLLPDELSRRAAQLNEDAHYLISQVDPIAYQSGQYRGATSLEKYIRQMWAQSAELGVRALSTPPSGDEGKGLDALSKLVMAENERRAQLADGEMLASKPVAQGGLGELSDNRLYTLIQNTAVNLRKLNQTEGNEAARSFLALASRQAMNLLNGRATSNDFSAFLSSVSKGTFTTEEIIAMSKDQRDNLANVTSAADSVESNGLVREEAQVAFREDVARKRAAFDTDRDGTLGAIHKRNVERQGAEGRKEIFPPHRRWLVITGDHFKDDGAPSAFTEIAAASGQLVAIDGYGPNSPLRFSDTRDRLARSSGGRTEVSYLKSMLNSGRMWDLVGVDGDPSRALINPDHLEASFLSHIAPGGAAVMRVTLTDNTENLTGAIIRKVDPLWFGQSIPETDEFAGNFRWAVVPTQLVRILPGHDGRLRFEYGHANPRVDAKDPMTLYLLRNKADGSISDLGQRLLELDKAARAAHAAYQSYRR